VSDLHTDRLSEYLDDALDAAARAELAAHVETCAECRATLDGLRAVVGRARSLGPIEPDTDLWSGISARIGDGAAPAAAAGRAHAGEPAPVPDATPGAAPAPLRIESQPRWFAVAVRLTLPQLAAAGLLIALLSGGAAWWLLRAPAGVPGGAPVAANDGGATDATPAGTDAFPGEGGYEATIADLERTLDRGQSRLDPETVRVLRDNLAIIDAAIADSRRALAADPESPYLYRHLNQQMQRKVDLLQQATVYAFASQ
jgi:hypothetical protein